MADPVAKPVPSATGTYSVLKPIAQAGTAGGNRVPEGGNASPVQATETEDVEEIVRELNTVSESIGRDLRFQVDLERGRTVIQVLDRETGEVIRQIPPEKADVYRGANGAAQLRLLDSKA